MLNKITLLSFLSFLFVSLQAQDADKGWEWIEKGEFVEAQSAFTSVLKADSSNEKALLGALFLSDVAHDSRLFEKLARKLIHVAPRDAYFQAFFDEFFSDSYRDPQGRFSGSSSRNFRSQRSLGGTDNSSDPDLNESDIEWLRETESIALRYRLPVLIDDVFDSKKATKTYETFTEALSPWFDNQGWSYIGPFKNINGAGLEQAYGPENEGFSINAGANYDNGMGEMRTWFTPPYIKPLGPLIPSDNLTENLPADLFYASKTFSLDSDQKLRLYITRNSPIVIWLDGQKVFKSRDPRGLFLDDETVELNLSAGTHEWLVKIAPHGADGNQQATFELLGSDPDNMRVGAGFCLRLCDEQGHIFPVNKTSSSAPKGKVLSHNLLPEAHELLIGKHLEHNLEVQEQYLLARLFLVKGLGSEGEQFFYFLNEESPTALTKTLLAAIYARNGNQVMVYETLKEFDTEDFPHFALAARKLENTDPEVDRELFEHRLEFMREIALSNPNIITYYLEYYAGREDTAKVENFKKEVLKAWPDYEEMMEEYSEYNNLEGYSYFNFDKYRKRKRRKNKTLDRVEDMLALRPDQVSGYEGMASYLEEKKEDLDGALAMVNKGLLIAPFEQDLLLKKASLFLKMDKKDSALSVYRFIKKINIDAGFGGIDNDLEQKIENLSGSKDQDDSKLFESIELDDILAKRSEWETRYKDEDAVILVNHKTFLLKEDGQLKSWHKFIVLVNTEAGVQSWTNNYFSEMGRNIVAQVRKADGSFYQPEVRGSSVVAQNLQPGDMLIIDGISSGTTKSSHRNFGLSEVFSLFEAFQQANPIYSQEVIVAVPEGFDIDLMTHHMDKADHKKVTEKGLDKYLWIMKNVPPYVEEEASLGRWIGSPKLQASKGISWTDISNWYQDMTYRKLEPNYQIKALHDSLVDDGMSKEEIVQAVYRYITRDIQYVSSFLQDGFEPQRPEVTCSAGVGDCKDVATLMITLLRMSDIQADYVLVLSNAYVPFKVLPINFFNHAIVAYDLNGKTHYVDLTTERYPYYAIPEVDQGAWALLIRPGEQDIFRLPQDQLNPNKNLITFDLKANMSDSVHINIDISATYPGNEGGRMREFMGAQGKNTAAYYRSELSIQSLPEVQLSDLDYQNLDDFAKPLKFKATMSAGDAAENLYGLHVMATPCLDRGPIPSALLTPERYRMLDLSQIMGVAPVEQTVTLKFPKGYKLFRTPPTARVDGPFGSYRLSFTKVPGGVKIEKYSDFTKTKIEADEYPAFREFYYQCNKLDRTKLVFIKEGMKLEIE